jgi:hypothetical protein
MTIPNGFDKSALFDKSMKVLISLREAEIFLPDHRPWNCHIDHRAPRGATADGDDNPGARRSATANYFPVAANALSEILTDSRRLILYQRLKAICTTLGDSVKRAIGNLMASHRDISRFGRS